MLGKDTEVTQSGQAIQINATAANGLIELFKTCLGPHGTSKMLISPSQSTRITKDGSTLIDDIRFTHPTTILINKAAAQSHNILGDGTSSFIVLCSEIFLAGCKYFSDGVPIFSLVNGLKRAGEELQRYFQENRRSVDDEIIKKMLFTSIRTKMKEHEAHKLSEIVFNAVNKIKNDNFDTNMIEVLKCQIDGETELINGIVLDHGNRNSNMPVNVNNCAVIISNISLEYEKP